MSPVALRAALLSFRALKFTSLACIAAGALRLCRVPASFALLAPAGPSVRRLRLTRRACLAVRHAGASFSWVAIIACFARFAKRAASAFLVFACWALIADRLARGGAKSPRDTQGTRGVPGRARRALKLPFRATVAAPLPPHLLAGQRADSAGATRTLRWC